MKVVMRMIHPTPSRKHGADRRRALALHAGCTDGAIEAVLLVHGFAVELLDDIIRDGLATGNPNACAPAGERSRLAFRTPPKTRHECEALFSAANRRDVPGKAKAARIA
jgi:hypothetical protein